MPDDTWSPPSPSPSWPPASAPGGPPGPGAYPPPVGPPLGAPGGPGAPSGPYEPPGPPFPAQTGPSIGGFSLGNRKARPWWGIGDVLASIILAFVLAYIGFRIGVLFVSPADRSGMLTGEIDPAGAALAASLLTQQAAQGGLPYLVSRWKGLGMVRDWHLAFKPVDILLGAGTAAVAVALSGIAGTVVAHLVNLANESEADNTQFLVDAKGSVWLWVLLLSAVVGAPVVEELFFRGMALRAFEKRWGPVAGVIGSTAIFTVLHVQKFELAPTAVLFASIGCVGLVLAVVAVKVGRLGPTIVAHMIFNAVGSASALGMFHGLKT